MCKISFLSFLLVSSISWSQGYTSWFTGNQNDAVTTPQGGICLMGGASENDEAMKWFLQRCNGGDVLVLRASGSDGYNTYLFSDLGIQVNSVETIRFDSPAAASNSYVKDKISKAEAIWIAGGDQWNYVSFWRNTLIDSLINKGISERNIVIGGTSAGMAIQGSHYFTAENGTVASATALANPYSASLTVSSEPFLVNAWLENVITDTHYNNPDRKGRHTVFMARALKDEQIMLKGIACNEYTAVCIDMNGLARVFGEFSGDNAYFIQPNCELSDPAPETCQLLTPLTWNHNGSALKVYEVPGNMTGSHTFDLSDWKTGNGGSWKHWSVIAGTFSEAAGSAPNCALSTEEGAISLGRAYPNPVSTTHPFIYFAHPIYGYELFDAEGRSLGQNTSVANEISLAGLKPGVYFIRTKDTFERVLIID